MSTFRRLRSLLLIASASICFCSESCFGQQIVHSLSDPSTWIEDQSLPPSYLSSYQKWLEGEILSSKSIQKEIMLALKLPPTEHLDPLTPIEAAEIAFSGSDGSLPSNLEIVKGNNERIACLVHRIARNFANQMAADEVLFVCETEVRPEIAPTYRELGLFVDSPIRGSNPPLDTILKASFFCNIRARCHFDLPPAFRAMDYLRVCF